MSNKKKLALVIFKEGLFKKSDNWWRKFDVIVAPKNWESKVLAHGLVFVNIDDLIEPGSIYEASALVEELSRLKLTDGARLSKSVIYRGYELWWMSYNGLFLYFCLPFTQYKKLLEYLKNFQHIYFYHPPYKSLFSCYLKGCGRDISILREPGLKIQTFFHFGIWLQVLFTILSLPILIIRQCQLMVFIGDKFEKERDFDFRMRFIYQELRQREIPFIEFIRSLESWKTVWQHLLVRKRPVIYSEAVIFAGRFLGFFSGGRVRLRRKFDNEAFLSKTDPERRFKLLIATQQLRNIYDDIWAIWIMEWILWLIGVKSAFFAAALDRNFHAFLGCKLNNIPTVGILHGVASRYYNGYDFLPAFDSPKMLSVDKYGLWSEWWKEYYLKNSKAYRLDQLFVSGPMRPLERETEPAPIKIIPETGPIKVLFVSEQLAVPAEVIPYLEALLQEPNIEIIFTFRQFRDGFKNWLTENRPQFLQHPNIKIAQNSLIEALRGCDVAVGSHSTAVLEALLQTKIPIFFQTQKWGDYYRLKEYDTDHTFFAANPVELIEKIKNGRSVSVETLKDLQQRYFGNPYQNGGKWVVDQLIGCLTKR